MAKRKFPLWGFIKRHYLIMALALILVVEVALSGSIYLSSRNASYQTPLVVSSPVDTKINGVTFYESGRSATVDNALLENLAQLHSNGVNTVLLPMDFLSHMDGSTIDGAWLGQIATVMEMIFQSNCRVILGVPAFGDGTISATDYAAMWQQIDDAFGHRPATELWYGIYVPADADLSSFELKLLATVGEMRDRNSQREILLLLDKDLGTEQRDEVISTFSSFGVNIGLYATSDMDSEFLYLCGLQSQLSAAEHSLVIVGDDGSMGDEALTAMIENIVEQGEMSCLLQAN